MCVEISYSSFSAYFVCLYRRPGRPVNLFEEFQDLLEDLATLHSELYIFGDFNVHLDKHTAAAIYCLVPVLRQMLELELFQLLYRLRGTHSLLVLGL